MRKRSKYVEKGKANTYKTERGTEKENNKYEAIKRKKQKCRSSRKEKKKETEKRGWGKEKAQRKIG